MPDPLLGVGSILQANSSRKAANAQADAANRATDIQWQMYSQTREDQAPWRQAGVSAVNELNALMQPGGYLYDTAPTIEDLQMDPGYAWRTQEGINALMASGAASGSYGSGNLGKALVDYGQNAASGEYQNAYSRWLDARNTLYNRLAGISGTGQVSSQAIGNMGMNAATNAGNYALAGAQAIGQGYMGQANAYSGGINQLHNSSMSGLGTWMNYNQNQQLMNMLNNNYGYGNYGYSQPGYAMADTGQYGYGGSAGGY